MYERVKYRLRELAATQRRLKSDALEQRADCGECSHFRPEFDDLPPVEHSQEVISREPPVVVLGVIEREDEPRGENEQPVLLEHAQHFRDSPLGVFRVGKHFRRENHVEFLIGKGKVVDIRNQFGFARRVDVHRKAIREKTVVGGAARADIEDALVGAIARKKFLKPCPRHLFHAHSLPRIARGGKDDAPAGGRQVWFFPLSFTRGYCYHRFMTICYFGDYIPQYPRSRILIRGLELAGVTVVECNVPEGRMFEKLRSLYRKHKTVGNYDVMIVGWGNFRLMPIFARLITKKPIVWEPLFSLYDAWVFDRKLANPHGIKAAWYWIVDWLGCVFADMVILDTRANAEYFIRKFRIPERKFLTAYIGADPEIFRPRARERAGETFEVEFHGKYIPVQGTDVLVRAAKILSDDPEIHFTFIGSGQEAEATRVLARTLGVSNVTFLGYLPQTEIAGHIANADICVGLIGDVPRVGRAIPNKLYEAAAMGRVSLNADGPAIREVFTPGRDVVTVRAGDAEDVAKKIRELRADRDRVRTMGECARETYLKTATPTIIGKKLAEDLKSRFSLAT